MASGQPLGGYVGAEKGAAILGLERKREQLFAESDQERKRLQSETASYRLQTTSSKFASSSNAVDVSLQEATVGLVSKQEFARRRLAIERSQEATGDVKQPPPEQMGSKEAAKKRKKKANMAALSFAFDDGEDEGEQASHATLPKKKATFARSAESDKGSCGNDCSGPTAASTSASPPSDRAATALSKGALLAAGRDEAQSLQSPIPSECSTGTGAV
mmetsp:Transcript_12815/g.32798  ORF Transcript_12815/g.32798 Transcript_12815/m.32798 type:complete len:217 (+) Transcript_12815:89-739(+)|eukprot:CAMPEP_0115851834 /NCGR_PEP_ID=MMETSP0287-20121206/12685_1 /TAXON_ID=412157 /ORGANISM="Chrysochromulina rotalis, Strain UIO044" /LENGTH=216 /DNA_ID=CAMNT_0003305877 /DNA_START=55 /DNA_END=705 /DNA_ORIENTATION=-